jgi:alpha-tubulin suppressor-like RCC1 family protein
MIFTTKAHPLPSLIGVKSKQIVLGRDHVLLFTSNNELYGWGSNQRG